MGGSTTTPLLFGGTQNGLVPGATYCTPPLAVGLSIATTIIGTAGAIYSAQHGTTAELVISCTVIAVGSCTLPVAELVSRCCRGRTFLNWGTSRVDLTNRV